MITALELLRLLREDNAMLWVAMWCVFAPVAACLVAWLIMTNRYSRGINWQLDRERRLAELEDRN